MTTSATQSAALRRPAVPGVILEHLEEHAFLHVQRRKMRFSAEHTSRQLAEIERRIAAHWAGLEVGGEASVKLALEHMAHDDPWMRSSSLRTWLSLAPPSQTVWIEALNTLEPDHVSSWAEGLRALPAEVVESRFAKLAATALPAPALALMVDALAWHGSPPAAILHVASAHPEPVVRCAAARALGQVDSDAGELGALVDDADSNVRARAWWALFRHDPTSALQRARRASKGGSPDTMSLRFLGRFGSEQDLPLLLAAAGTEQGRPASFHALGDLGNAEACESLARLCALPDDELRLHATDALERALDRIPGREPEAPATPEQARARAADVFDSLREGARAVVGRNKPWVGDAADRPLLDQWWAALDGADPDLAREVPDGFFLALPVWDARTGE